MTQIFQNIFWCIVGIAGVIVVYKLKKKSTGDTSHNAPSDGSNSGISNVLTNEKFIQGTPESAKEAFLNNIQTFEAILPQLNNALNIEIWTEKIVSINNPQLTSYWKRYHKDINMWKRLLSSWGLRQDTCKSFTYLQKYSKMYDTDDSSTSEEGCMYQVIEGCWIMCDEATGNKKVIRKGIIKKV